MKSVTMFNQQEISKIITGDSIAIDATLGNGHDTLFLARKAKHVHGFDVQIEALENTKKRLKENGFDNVTLHHESHHKMDAVIPFQVDVIMFNFGYLPGGRKTITTQKETSALALEKACKLIKPGGIITLALYIGHKEGAEEAALIEETIKHLPKSRFEAISYKPLNKNSAPYSIIIEKRKD
jgi:ubiquinone/menaquinone biosynthesis C-methylase UbiE